jgi:hypothetical protein
MDQIITRSQLQLMALHEPRRRKRVGDMVNRVSNDVITLARNGHYSGVFGYVDSDIVADVYHRLLSLFPDSKVMSFGSGVRIDWS